MPTYFFLNEDSEWCYSKPVFIELMRQGGYEELKVFSAKIETGIGFFFCNHFSEITESGVSCGNQCTAYNPRNGKNGCCKHYRNSYVPDKEVTFKMKNH